MLTRSKTCYVRDEPAREIEKNLFIFCSNIHVGVTTVEDKICFIPIPVTSINWSSPRILPWIWHNMSIDHWEGYFIELYANILQIDEQFVKGCYIGMNIFGSAPIHRIRPVPPFFVRVYNWTVPKKSEAVHSLSFQSYRYFHGKLSFVKFIYQTGRVGMNNYNWFSSATSSSKYQKISFLCFTMFNFRITPFIIQTVYIAYMKINETCTSVREFSAPSRGNERCFRHSFSPLDV